jgi:serine/threonine-protein kinase
MSNSRFIRCPHCGIPHEAAATSCPLTGLALPKVRRKPVPRPPAAPRWAERGAPAPRPVQRAAEPVTPSAAPITAAALARGLGDRLLDGKYAVLGLIGRGAMGAVYAAEHVRLGKKVAIKVLHRERGPKSVDVKRFLREARVVGSLGHPNIVQVFDLGALDDGAPYLVMDRLEGETLADRLERGGALEPAALLHVMAEVLSALAVAHERGIVHRDLKPDNIFLARRPRLPEITKLLDFGVSKCLDDENTLTLTRTGVVVGTPYYLAPEQARGDAAIDHRVDVWAAGVVMYEAATGTMPFNAPNYDALLTKILHQRPAPPSRVRPGLPLALESLIMRALAYDPGDRFPSAEAMQGAVEAAAAQLIEDPAPTETIDVSTQIRRLMDELVEETVFDARASDVHRVDEVAGERTVPQVDLFELKKRSTH